MYSYLTLNIYMTVIAGGIALLQFRHWIRRWRRVVLLTITVLVLTAVFDNLILAAHIVAYHSDHLLGIYVGLAPIEDFCYALVAPLLTISLWERGT